MYTGSYIGKALKRLKTQSAVMTKIEAYSHIFRTKKQTSDKRDKNITWFLICWQLTKQLTRETHNIKLVVMAVKWKVEWRPQLEPVPQHLLNNKSSPPGYLWARNNRILRKNQWMLHVIFSSLVYLGVQWADHLRGERLIMSLESSQFESTSLTKQIEHAVNKDPCGVNPTASRAVNTRSQDC